MESIQGAVRDITTAVANSAECEGLIVKSIQSNCFLFWLCKRARRDNFRVEVHALTARLTRNITQQSFEILTE